MKNELKSIGKLLKMKTDSLKEEILKKLNKYSYYR